MSKLGEWANEQSDGEAASRELSGEVEIAETRVHVEMLLKSGDWGALNLPSPEKVIAQLENGDSVEVAGHRLVYEDDVLWFTNPYGQDGIVASAIDAKSILRFLADMARGIEYGPVPH